MSNVMTYHNELYHYGVKGMKWGVRNDKPTTGRRRSSRDKKNLGRSAVQRLYGSDRLSKNEGVVLAAIAANPELTAYAAMTAATLALYGAKKISDLNKQGWFTEKYKASDIKKTNTSKDEDINIINSIPGVSDSALRKIDETKDILQLSDSDQKAVIKAMKDGYFTNCVYCTTSAAMRRQGYDVVAKNSPGRGHTVGKMMKWWNGSKVENFRGESESNPKKATKFASDSMDKQFREYSKNKSSTKRADEIRHITKTLSSQKPGAYGDLLVHGDWTGHSVEYSVEKDGVKIYDNQTKRKYESLDEFFDANDYYPERSYFVRLDNCEPNIDRMLKEHVIKPRGN